jgi:diguanylate cyclase (GGDEF)-like protein
VDDGGGSQRHDRLVQLAPFALMAAAPLPLALLSSVSHTGALVASVVLTLAVAAAIVLLPWDGLPSGYRTGPVAVYCLAVACVRHAEAEASSGLVLLLMLPVLFQALYSRRRDLLVAVGLTTCTIVVPIVAIGAPTYPSTDWGIALLWVVISLVTGLVTNDLVDRLRAGEATLARITTVAHGLTTAGDNREGICQAAQEVSEAELVYLFEPTGDGRLVSTAAAGVVQPQIEIPIGGEASVTVQTYLAGRARFVSDLRLVSSPRLLAATKAASALFQPVLRGNDVAGVLFVGWRRPRRKVPARTVTGMRLLASEAALAMERADQMSQAARLARLDPLTGLPNRRSWDEEAARAVAVRQRSDEPVALGLIDLDRFKEFNDAHGHHEGDLLLKSAAVAWRDTLRGGDLLARWGGEEFAVLLPGCASAGALQVLERLRASTPLGATCSVGVTDVVQGDTLERAVRRADAALYRAKAGGRDRTVVDELPPPVEGVLVG